MRRGRHHDHHDDHDHDDNFHHDDHDHDVHHHHDMIRALVILCLGVSLAWADPYPLEQGSKATGTVVTCSGTTGVLLAGGARHSFRAVNHTTQDVFICFAATCTAATGILLHQFIILTDWNYTGTVSCITASSTTTVGVIADQ